jgi:hypothetical protein
MSLNEAIKQRREVLAKQPKAVQELRARLLEQAMRNMVLAQKARKAREQLEKRETQ